MMEKMEMVIERPLAVLISCSVLTGQAGGVIMLICVDLLFLPAFGTAGLLLLPTPCQ